MEHHQKRKSTGGCECPCRRSRQQSTRPQGPRLGVLTLGSDRTSLHAKSPTNVLVSAATDCRPPQPTTMAAHKLRRVRSFRRCVLMLPTALGSWLTRERGIRAPLCTNCGARVLHTREATGIRSNLCNVTPPSPSPLTGLANAVKRAQQFHDGESPVRNWKLLCKAD